jgi:hypothetical protein
MNDHAGGIDQAAPRTFSFFHLRKPCGGSTEKQKTAPRPKSKGGSWANSLKTSEGINYRGGEGIGGSSRSSWTEFREVHRDETSVVPSPAPLM